jgi:DNA-binding NarL/FixJ family response regulator
MERVISGLLNKQVAAELGTTEFTIKVHRGRVMRKMRAGSPGCRSCRGPTKRRSNLCHLGGHA